MANKTRSSFARRQKEVARQTRRKEKLARRLDARQKKAETGTETDPAAVAAAEDPDLAGIVLGPQPAAEEAGSDEDDA